MEAAIANGVFAPDASILLWVQENIRTPWLSKIMLPITYSGNAGILWILLTLLLIAIKKTRKVGITSAASILLTFIIVNVILKPSVARIRPYYLIEGLELMVKEESDFSFPSGHASNAFAAAIVMLHMMPKKYGVPAFILAILIALSRIYVGVHYPTDVIVGVIIGVVDAHICLALSRKYYKPLRKKFRRWLKARKAKA